LAKIYTVGSTDVTYSVVSYVSTGELHERLYAPHTLRGRAVPLLRDHLSDAALCRWLEAHAPQLGWPPDTWRLLYLSVLLAAQGQAAAWIGP
jgi:hypothetical protein